MNNLDNSNIFLNQISYNKTKINNFDNKNIYSSMWKSHGIEKSIYYCSQYFLKKVVKYKGLGMVEEYKKRKTRGGKMVKVLGQRMKFLRNIETSVYKDLKAFCVKYVDAMPKPSAQQKVVEVFKLFARQQGCDVAAKERVGKLLGTEAVDQLELFLGWERKVSEKAQEMKAAETISEKVNVFTEWISISSRDPVTFFSYNFSQVKLVWSQLVDFCRTHMEQTKIWKLLQTRVLADYSLDISKLGETDDYDFVLIFAILESKIIDSILFDVDRFELQAFKTAFFNSRRQHKQTKAQARRKQYAKKLSVKLAEARALIRGPIIDFRADPKIRKQFSYLVNLDFVKTVFPNNYKGCEPLVEISGPDPLLRLRDFLPQLSLSLRQTFISKLEPGVVLKQSEESGEWVLDASVLQEKRKAQRENGKYDEIVGDYFKINLGRVNLQARLAKKKRSKNKK